MALKREHPEVQQFVNLEKNGIADLDHLTIHQLGEMIQNAARTRAEANHICSPFGNLLAWLANATNEDRRIADVDCDQILMLYLYLAAAPYEGKKIRCSLHTFSDGSDEMIDSTYRNALRHLTFKKGATGMEKDTSSILQLALDGEVMAVYYPRFKCWLPGTKFAREEYRTIGGTDRETFLAEHPHIRERCRALLTDLLQHGAEPTVLGAVLGKIGGPLKDDEMKKFRAEEQEMLPQDVRQYILATSPEASPESVCGQMGTVTSQKMLGVPTFLYTGTASMLQDNRKFGFLNDHLTLIPPVQDTDRIEKAQYRFGPVQEDELPEWVEFTAELDGTLHHKIFCRPFPVYDPDHVLDLENRVPDGILRKYSYLKAESAAGSFDLDSHVAEWKFYPQDPEEISVTLKSRQYEGDEWKIVQRTKRIDKLELYDKESCRMLGTVIPEKAPAFKSAMNTMHVAVDPAGSVSVRLKSLKGSERIDAVSYQEMVKPLTPMAEKEFEQSVERRMVPADRSGTHFESLLQQFGAERSVLTSMPILASRIWSPDQEALFQGLSSALGTRDDAHARLGVMANMKELLTRTSSSVMDREDIQTAFKSYIGILLLEPILSLARDGFSVSDNLEFLISYPENGSREGITREMQEIIRGAIALVNGYLAPENQLEIGRNVQLCSESEAAAAWNQSNQQGGMFLGGTVALGTTDYGHSTHDFSLRANDELYLFSVPYAARKITNSTLVQVYSGKAEELLRCFQGGTPELKRKAQEALERVLNGEVENPVDSLGFGLTLSRLFAECSFCVTGVNSDRLQRKVQQLTELKLNVAIPAYAYMVKQALKDGNLEADQEIILTPVGRGSLALQNTAPGFYERFKTRMLNEIEYLIRKDPEFPEDAGFHGTIEIMNNHDVDKTSVAKGLIRVRQQGAKRTSIAEREDPVEHYLDLAFGSEKDCGEAKKRFFEEYAALDKPVKRQAHNEKYRELYQQAFRKLMKDYTCEKFESAFERFGYTDIDEGIPQEEIGKLDSQILHYVRTNFSNLCAELTAKSQELIMSVPFVEEEMICGALLDLSCEKLDLG